MATQKQLQESAIRKIYKVLTEQFTEKDLKFVDGRAIVKSGRKIVGKVYDKEIFYKRFKDKSYDKEYP